MSKQQPTYKKTNKHKEATYKFKNKRLFYS